MAHSTKKNFSTTNQRGAFSYYCYWIHLCLVYQTCIQVFRIRYDRVRNNQIFPPCPQNVWHIPLKKILKTTNQRGAFSYYCYWIHLCLVYQTCIQVFRIRYDRVRNNQIFPPCPQNVWNIPLKKILKTTNQRGAFSYYCYCIHLCLVYQTCIQVFRIRYDRVRNNQIFPPCPQNVWHIPLKKILKTTNQRGAFSYYCYWIHLCLVYQTCIQVFRIRYDRVRNNQIFPPCPQNVWHIPLKKILKTTNQRGAFSYYCYWIHLCLVYQTCIQVFRIRYDRVRNNQIFPPCPQNVWHIPLKKILKTTNQRGAFSYYCYWIHLCLVYQTCIQVFRIRYDRVRNNQIFPPCLQNVWHIPLKKILKTTNQRGAFSYYCYWIHLCLVYQTCIQVFRIRYDRVRNNQIFPPCLQNVWHIPLKKILKTTN